MTGVPPEIRLAKSEDAGQIAALLHESFAEFRSLYTDEAFAATAPEADEILKRISEGTAWVAFHQDQLIGTVSVLGDGESLYIRGMAVLPAARGAGTAKLLLRQIEEFAIERSYQRLFLSTTPFLSSAIYVYEKFGFQRTDDGPHDLFGTPLFTMEKFLVEKT